MIRSICLNPVIDRMYFINGFTAGTQYPETVPCLFVGGKGVNIARVVRLFDEPCALYGFIGGSNGEKVLNEMKALGVELHMLEFQGETRTTVNIIDLESGRETEITEPSVQIGEAEEQRFLAGLEHDLQEGDLVACSGIPMRGMRADIYREVAALCRKKKAKCVLDANHQYLRESFPQEYDLAKPNWTELNDLHGVHMPFSLHNVLLLGRRTMAMGVKNLLITTGETGGVLMSPQGDYQAQFPPQKIVSTIGSGDASVAGFCIGMRRGMPLTGCLRLAMACGMCNAMFDKVGYIENDLVETLYAQVEITKVNANSEQPGGEKGENV